MIKLKNRQTIFDKLAEKYKLAGDAHFMEFLKMMLTPEEGNYLLALDKPKTPAELAEILKRDEKTVNEKLEKLTQCGLLVQG
jgi:predicted transcriptional regulator